MANAPPMLDSHTPAAKPGPVRLFGRFQLRQLLGKSVRTMVWLAFDPRASQEVMLTMPRAQPANEAELAAWKRDNEHAARLKHPNLAHVIEIGLHDHWPYVVVDRALGQTLGERLAAKRVPTPMEAVEWTIQLLEGLAFAHQAGVVHGDLQLHQVLIGEQGSVRVMALAACGVAYTGALDAMPNDPNRLQVSRQSAQRDVLTAGLLLHHLLAGQPSLEEPDTGRVVERMPPIGREIIRLPWSTPQPVPEALRAIANRATERQERQRYHNARTFLTALSGWREAAANDSGGPLALLLDRLHSVGHLPAAPGVGARVARMALAEGQRTDEMAEQVLQDMALSFELLRHVNSAAVQGTQVSGNGPVLTLRRAIALVGVKGLRQAAAALRPWPGPLSEPHARALEQLMERVRLAGHVAQVLQPAGYDPEVVFLITIMQNLGRLMVQYHFPEEAEQIRQLMQTLPASEPGEPDQPGMTEEGASFAVLGVDIENLGAAVARHWGLNDEVLHMIRRLPAGRPVRAADGDADALRLAASAGNDVVDVVTREAPSKVASALNALALRYGRALDVDAKAIGEALQSARIALRNGKMALQPQRSPPAQEPAAQPAGPSDFAKNLASRHSH